MRRGHNFQAQVQKVIDYINNIGFHAHQNYPERTLAGVFVTGEPFDYEIFLPDHHHVFDAKECDTDSWHMQKKDIVQAEHLKHCKNAGLEAYFLIRYKSGVRQVDVDIAIDNLRHNMKTIHFAQGKEWRIPEIIRSREEPKREIER